MIGMKSRLFRIRCSALGSTAAVRQGGPSGRGLDVGSERNRWGGDLPTGPKNVIMGRTSSSWSWPITGKRRNLWDRQGWQAEGVSRAGPKEGNGPRLFLMGSSRNPKASTKDAMVMDDANDLYPAALSAASAAFANRPGWGWQSSRAYSEWVSITSKYPRTNPGSGFFLKKKKSKGKQDKKESHLNTNNTLGSS